MITLVTGGARSGKSKRAEELIGSVVGQKLYIATAIPFDEEMKDRIKKHQNSRPADWTTYEGYKELAQVVIGEGAQYEGILLDCVTLWLTNLLFDCLGNSDIEEFKTDAINDIETQIMNKVQAFMESLRIVEAAAKSPMTVVLVTNEIGMGLVPENKLSRVFRDIQGRVNQYLGRNCDQVELSVCGISMKIK
jgi:adenosylcobinamide kinase / adenosylcobinamide-phosphate guanylyltransferase